MPRPHRRLSAVLLVVSGAAIQAAVQTQPRPARAPFTIEQVLGAPFPYGVTAAPTGGAFAWVFNHKGVRNIWVAGPPDYKGRPVTQYTDDDGQEIGDLQWTPDAGAIVFVRGSGANRKGEVPNPTSDPAGVEQAIWVVNVTGEEPRRVAEGRLPEIDPGGRRLTYVRHDQIWSAPLKGDEKPVELVKMRGKPSALKWSPDGSRLGLVSTRDDHSFVGVYDPAARTLRFIDPSTDRDGRLVWSPDSRRLAYIRIPASRVFFSFGPQRAAEPWSIRVADVSTGAAGEVWKAHSGTGSAFRGLDSDEQLFWTAGDRLVFPWEREGWTHLYSVPASGGQAQLLTPGSFEVEHIALSRDRTTIFYSSNQDDTDRRHIWTVRPTGGAPRGLTRGTGIEWSPVPASDGKTVAFLRSGARTPAHPVVQADGTTARELAPGTIPADFPADDLVEPQAVHFTATDGMRIPAQLFVAKRGAGRRPAVIFFHGGSRRQMLLGFHYSPYYHNSYSLNQYLASRGYVVLSVNYRSGIGYGMEFREALRYGAHGASEFNDVMGAGLYLQNRPDVDPKRIGLWGGSYGGYLTAMGLSRASDMFAAGVDIHGVHDWNIVIHNFTQSYDPAEHEQLARLAHASSPMASIATWRSPVLLIHGDDDRNVPFSETVDLAEALRKQDVEFEQLVFPDEVHSFLRYVNWVAAFKAAAAFFDKHLGRVDVSTSGY